MVEEGVESRLKEEDIAYNLDSNPTAMGSDFALEIIQVIIQDLVMLIQFIDLDNMELIKHADLVHMVVKIIQLLLEQFIPKGLSNVLT